MSIQEPADISVVSKINFASMELIFSLCLSNHRKTHPKWLSESNVHVSSIPHTSKPECISKAEVYVNWILLTKLNSI